MNTIASECGIEFFSSQLASTDPNSLRISEMFPLPIHSMVEKIKFSNPNVILASYEHTKMDLAYSQPYILYKEVIFL